MRRARVNKMRRVMLKREKEEIREREEKMDNDGSKLTEIESESSDRSVRLDCTSHFSFWDAVSSLELEVHFSPIHLKYSIFT